MAREIKTVESGEAEDIVASVEAQERLLRKLEEKVEASAERLKGDKAEYAEAIAELRKLAGTRLDTPLFDAKEKP